MLIRSESETQENPSVSVDSDATIKRAMNTGDQRGSPQVVLKRPKWKCVENNEYTSNLVHGDTEMDEDYVPTEPPPKRRKFGPSASHISARTFDKNRSNKKEKPSPKTENTSYDRLQPNQTKTAKGSIGIIIKTMKECKMKCPSCPKIGTSTKRLNDHHKKVHVLFAMSSLILQVLYIMLCSHLTFASTSPSSCVNGNANINAQIGSEPILGILHSHTVKLDGDIDANANVKCEHSISTSISTWTRILHAQIAVNHIPLKVN